MRWMLLAEVNLPGAEWGLVGIGFVGMLGLFVWIVRHIFTVSFPAMLQAQSKILEENTRVHAEIAAKISDNQTSITNGMIERFAKEQSESRQRYMELISAERSTCERRHEENKEVWKMHTTDSKATHMENMKVLREICGEFKALSSRFPNFAGDRAENNGE